MWPTLITGFLFSAAMSWRLVTVVATSTDETHRRDAIRLCGYLWAGGTTGTGVISAVIKANELGLLQ